ncbi:VOC family protein [Paenibacillus sp. MMS18-CY102]|uniref:VOC family protein n=1 Tax=Paenibacillus sp. MMS18-CY102 TaxID=2682849 RepID=UPI001365BD9C|nr:hypothetical protein [Paenibacillus sp. MMS18-CY102]MWC28042.1 hypothetical protein [Paenibacillus sp. MMS18-CY102]
MTQLSILDFSFKDDETRMKDFQFIQQVLQLNVLFESDVYSSMMDETGLSIGFMNTNELEEAAQEGYKASVVPNFSVDATKFDAMLAQALEQGGKILMPKTYIEGTGFYAIIQTPSGINLALAEQPTE